MHGLANFKQQWNICYSFTKYGRKCHRQHQFTLQHVCKAQVLFVCVDIHVSLCMHACSIQNASEQFVSCIHLRYASNRTNKNLTHQRRGRRRTLRARFKQLYSVINHKTFVRINFLFLTDGWYCHLSRHWPFLLDHPVYWNTNMHT